ncbi:VOC family protein [Spongiactinospora sp. 9N601]|uniref:VOC family protein n=1 Tax=Spongiactinospora sp. 9N601 TaxID=3375149 RepID=UPI0037AFA77F
MSGGDTEDLRWSHAALNCRDIDATAEFYCRWFGFVRAAAFPVGDTKIVFLRKGDAYLELFQAAEGPADDAARGDGPVRAGTLRHIALRTDDIDRVLARMGPQAQVSLGPLCFDEFVPGWRSVWVKDPDGTVVEISQGYKDQTTGGEDDAQRH